MLRYVPIRRGLCFAMILSLAGTAQAGDGIYDGPIAPGCPAAPVCPAVPACPAGPPCRHCNDPGSPPCPANVKYFGYYPTCWRRWPGTEPMPAMAPNTTPNPNDVEVPPAAQEANSRPGGPNDNGASTTASPTTGDFSTPPLPTTPGGAPGGATPGAAAPGGTAPGATAPGTTPGGTVPSGTLPGAGTPMLNGTPLPSGTTLPNGLPATLPNGAPTPGTGAAPNFLPTPGTGAPPSSGSQIYLPSEYPLAMRMQSMPVAASAFGQAWPVQQLPAGPAAGSMANQSAAIQSTAIQSTAIQPIAARPIAEQAIANRPFAAQPAIAQSIGMQSTGIPAIAIQPTAIQPTAIQPLPKMQPLPGEPNELHPISPQPLQTPPSMPVAEFSAAAGQSVQPISQVSTPEASRQWPPPNMLRSSTMKTSFQSPEQSTSNPAFPPASSGENSAWNQPTATVTPVAQKPESSSIRSENVSLRLVGERPASAAPISADDWSPDGGKAPESTANSSTSADVSARFSLPNDRPQDQFVHPASWNQPAPGSLAPVPAVVNPSSRAASWPAANSPASLAPIYGSPPAGRPYGATTGISAFNAGAAGLNAPGAISAMPSNASQAPADPMVFSPLRDAVANLHPITDDRAGKPMAAIDPLQIGSATADDGEPAMKALPIENGLPKDRFQASDYVPQDRGTAATASAPQPAMLGTSGRVLPAPQQAGLVQPALQQAGFVQPMNDAAPKLQSIDPLEVARSLSAAPAAAANRPAGY